MKIGTLVELDAKGWPSTVHKHGTLWVVMGGLCKRTETVMIKSLATGTEYAMPPEDIHEAR